MASLPKINSLLDKNLYFSTKGFFFPPKQLFTEVTMNDKRLVDAIMRMMRFLCMMSDIDNQRFSENQTSMMEKCNH